MKKTGITAMIMSVAMLGISVGPAFSANAADETEAAGFAESVDSFFVVVGTYSNEYTQLRYIYTKSNGEMGAEKVITNADLSEYKYGDVLVADGEPELTVVYPYLNDPVYSHANYCELSDETALSLLGSCADLMPRKELTVTRKVYDGSGHWSIHFTDENECNYYYGYSAVGSNLEFDLSKSEVGEVCNFAMFGDTPAAVCVAGDANLDVKVSVADSVAILQHISNRDKYGLNTLGRFNADVDGISGVTANDARVLQGWDAGIR
ncbi:MAG: hypothetical protein K6G82_07425 [Ruminococcus sp.]|nr:hypothetical protein [Ruminococcus sp.]